MPCSVEFSVTLSTEIFSTETLDFFKQIIFLTSFSSVVLFQLAFPDNDENTKVIKEVLQTAS